MSAPVRVYLTIDTECAEERGTAPALGYDLRVWGRLANQRRALGIELIMDELERRGLAGTFFVEALGAASFGEDGLAEVVHALVARGHDVQLHAHPIQERAYYRSHGEPPACDDIGSYPVEIQADLLRRGVAILERCGAPAGSVRAFRAGNFGASNATWEAMARAGLVLSASYDPCYFARNCKMRFAGASAGLFLAEHGIWELPLSNFRERDGGARHAQITAVSAAELRALLDHAHATGIGEVTILTHSFELFHLDSIAERRGRPSTVNVLRLRALCDYLAANRDRFAVDTCGALAARLARGDERPASAPVPLASGAPLRRALRLAAQAYKRLEQRLPWSPSLV